jgi:U3 small nucleolar RNA-associated protein 15
MSSTPTTTIKAAPTSTSGFKSSVSLQTQKPNTAPRSIADSLATASSSSNNNNNNNNNIDNISEARYWTEKFGFGNRAGKTPVFAHARKLNLQASSSAIIHQVLFAPPPVSAHAANKQSAASTSSSSSPLAVVSGPRVLIYGTSFESPFHSHLRKQQQATSSTPTASLLSAEKNLVDDVPADRQIPTAGSLALHAAYRHDGRLLAVATDNGQVRVADATSRAVLCTFQVSFPSRLPVRSVSWFRNGQHIFTAGDDGIARVMELSANNSNKSAIVELKGHGDAIRCATIWQPSAKDASKWPRQHQCLGFTGSYDHTIRIWNLSELEQDTATTEADVHHHTEDRCLSVLTHGAPVESVLLMPSSNVHVPVWLLSAGGTNVKVWNPVTGQCVCDLENNARHRKTITSLLGMPRENRSDDSNSSKDNDDEGAGKSTFQMRVLTGGLDGYLNVHDWNSKTGRLQHLHGISLPVTGISALGVNESADRMAIGTVEGMVLVRQRGPSVTQKRKRDPRAGTYAYFTRGMNADVVAGDFVVEENERKKKLRKFDVALRQFRYGDALDEALESRMPQAVVGILEELGKRGGLKIALSNRDEESLEPILSFLVRYICMPNFAALLIGVTHTLIDIYSGITGQSEVIDELFEKIKTQVTNECKAQQLLLGVAGQLDAIMAAAEFDGRT